MHHAGCCAPPPPPRASGSLSCLSVCLSVTVTYACARGVLAAILAGQCRLTIQKKRLLAVVGREVQRHRRFSAESGSSWFAAVRRVGSFISRSAGVQTKVGRFEEDAHNIRAEIRATEELQRSLFLELVDLHAARERELHSRTCRGRIVNLFGHVLVAVCVFRIVAAAVTLVFKRRRIDPVTRIMDLTNHSNAESVIGELDANERKFWSQFISFILIGVIIVSSIRHVLRRMMQFFSVRVRGCRMTL
jgi:hypothetical protein